MSDRIVESEKHKALAISARPTGPVHGSTGGIDRDAVISILRFESHTVVLSRFQDDVWDLGAEIHQGHMRSGYKHIHWDLDLPDGMNLLHPKHAKKLESAKRFVYSILFNRIDGKKQPRASTVVHKYHVGLAPFLRWMTLRGYDSFTEISDPDDYVAFCRTYSGRKGQRPSKSTVRQRLEIVVDCWDHRVHLDDCVKIRPWPRSSPEKLAGIKQTDRKRPKTREIPEVALLKVVTAASKYINERADAIMGARIAVEEARTIALERGVGKLYAMEIASKVARKLRFRELYELTREETRLRTACYILMLALTGMRMSEVLSLEVGCVFLSSLPNGKRVIRVRGTLYKGVDDPRGRPAEWIVPPLVAAAVYVMERLTMPLRKKLRAEEREIAFRLDRAYVGEEERRRMLKRLSIVSTQKDKLFLTGLTGFHEVEVPSATVMGDSLKEFARLHEVCDEQGRPWNLTAHQFRRTFACVVARLRGGDLLCLQDQLKHWTLDRTIYYADGALDRSLLDEMFESEGKLEMRQSFAQRRNGAGVSKVELPVIIAASKADLLARLEPEVYLRGAWHGWCVAGPSGQRDHRCPVDALVNAREWGPNEAREFLPVLKAIEEQQEGLLGESGWREPGLTRAKVFLRLVKEAIDRAGTALGGAIR